VLANDDPPELLAQPGVEVSELADRLDVIFVEVIHERTMLPPEVTARNQPTTHLEP
jgi:hypothetical protein